MRPRRVAVRGLGLILLLVSGVAGCIAWYGSGPAAEPPPDADVAVVLGAAVWGDAPSPVFQARIEHALDLYAAGTVERLAFTGGSRADTVREESAVARDAARSHGIPDRVIVAEAISRTTAANLACIAPLVSGERVILVSDPLHLRRAIWMAEDLGMRVTPSATPSTRYRSLWARARFLARETGFTVVYAVERLAGPPACPKR